MLKVAPVSAVICDAIRQENNGKLLMIGVYPGAEVRITPHTMLPQDAQGPTTMDICMLLQFSADAPGQAHVELRVFRPADNVGLMANIDIFVEALSRTGTQSISLNQIPLLVDQEGPVQISLRNEGDEDWKLVTTVQIIFVDDLFRPAVAPRI